MKLFAALLIALVCYTVSDILIWQRIFERNELWQYAGTYHRGWFVMLYGYIGLGVVLLDGWRDKVFYSLTLWVMCHNGTNDVLYYWLDGRALPERLEWLDRHRLILFLPVTDEALLASCAVWLAVLAGLYFVLQKGNLCLPKNRKFLF